MNIALTQMNVHAGDPEKNFRQMKEWIMEAKDNGADIIIFPEMCVGGYLVGDKWLSDSWCEKLMSYNDKIRELSHSIGIIYGNVYYDKSSHKKNQDGRRRRYNAAYAYQDGKPVLCRRVVDLPDGVTIKTNLPNYRYFDDKRYFSSTIDLCVEMDLDLKNVLHPFRFVINNEVVNIGIELCEDMWCDDYTYKFNPTNVTNTLLDNGAESIVNLSASPWTFGKNGARDRRVKTRVLDADGKFKPFYYVNCVGAQNNGKNIVTFDGDTSIYDADGDKLDIPFNPYEEKMIIHNTEGTIRYLSQKKESPIPQKYAAIIEGIKHMDEVLGSPNYVLGISGGIDSAVIICLLEDAVGKDKIFAYNLPTEYNSERTKMIAQEICEDLDIYYKQLSIEGILAENLAVLEESGIEVSMTNLENIQAKIRGTSMLSNLAAMHGGVMVNCGNKTETAFNYATLYGDVNGAFSPIGDLLKSEVFDMARFINKKHGKELISEMLIPDKYYNWDSESVQPSPELLDNQVDSLKYGYHDALVEYFTNYKKGTREELIREYDDGDIAAFLQIPRELIYKYQLDFRGNFIQDLDFVCKQLNLSFKRLQASPIIILSKSAFGFDIREAQLPYIGE